MKEGRNMVLRCVIGAASGPLFRSRGCWRRPLSLSTQAPSREAPLMRR
jgi:hypothetical protein